MSDDKSKLVPKIRFKGFTDAWKQRKLGDVVDKLRSYPLSRDVETKEITGYRYIHYGDIHKQVADIISSDEQLPRIRSGEYNSIKQRDLVLADASEDYTGIAEPCVILHEPKEKIVAGLHTIAIRPIKIDSLYLYYLLHTEDFKKFASYVGTGLKVFGITFPNLIKYETCMPEEKNEQTRIGNFFRTLDDTITFHKRKLNSLKELKKGYLQQMFPQAGEVTPRIRFTGFTGEWVERKLDGYIEDYIEKTIVQNQYPVLTSSQQHGIVFQEDYFANRQVTTEDNIGYFVLPKGYFTYRSRSDNNVFKFNRNDIIENGIISYFYPVFKIVNGNSDFFLQYLNSSIDKKVALEAEGTGQKVLSLKKFKNIDVIVPILAEQTAIGNFFRNLDEQIANQQTKLEKFKQLKAAYLQKMFV